MINYTSTRGNKKQYSFSEVVLKGIATDGGLLVPDKIPTFSLDQLAKLQNTSYAEKALFVLSLLETDVPYTSLKQLTEKTFGEKTNFFNKKIAPLKQFKENLYMLELWHGPTWAFKDMALQFMPLLFAEAIKINNKKHTKHGEKPLQYLILVSTSGDTGKAALEGYKDKEDISIIVLFPDKRVSFIQELSMITQEGNNIEVYSIYGNFDDAQQLVKTIFNDKSFNRKLLRDYAVSLSSASSMNWGRFLPQIFYYISSYINLLEKNVIKLGDEIDYAIPTGNFGNILAGYFAKRIGLPIRKLISASNENNVLVEFFQTGIFDATKRSMVKTPSPAMDILIPNNHERLLYFLTKDTDKISSWMQQSKEQKKFIVDEQTKKQLRKLFYSDWVSNQDCLKKIKQVFNETGYLIDPHTAVVTEVVNRYKKQQKDDVPVIICSTAHWAKFPNDVYKALLGKANVKFDEFEMIKKISEFTHSPFPKNLMQLKEKPILHREKLEAKKEIVEEKIILFLNKNP